MCWDISASSVLIYRQDGKGHLCTHCMCLFRLCSSLKLILLFVHLSFGQNSSLLMIGGFISFIPVFSSYPSEDIVLVNNPLFEWTNSWSEGMCSVFDKSSNDMIEA